MATQGSSKPYLIRAICEWCGDNGFTPYLAVKVDARTRVPLEYVKNGEIVLNISRDATHRLTVGDDFVQFAARFNGTSRECSIPIAAVAGIFARENGHGIFFSADDAASQSGVTQATPELDQSAPAGRVRLQVVK
ncbi:MAG TPA: ClpXP protease specificity-enhancing factor [Burkholderiales bacterium]|nr:ClpXP protease specificity-enhancing factor [Burkholderiales bacterium]